MSICVPHPNFGCLIRCCALFCQNASGVYTSGPGPWEVSPASSGTLWTMTSSIRVDWVLFEVGGELTSFSYFGDIGCLQSQIYKTHLSFLFYSALVQYREG